MKQFNIPEEIVRYEILIHLDHISLLNYFKTSKGSANCCSDPLFMKTYNKKFSHDEYQSLVLREASAQVHRGDFFTLVDKAELFDQIVDKKTLNLAYFHFAEVKDIKSMKIIEGSLNSQFLHTNFSIDSRLHTIDQLRETVEIMKANAIYVNFTPQLKERIEKLICSIFTIDINVDYIGSFFIKHLTFEQIFRLLKVIVNFQDRLALLKEYHIFRTIVGELLKNNNKPVEVDLTVFDCLIRIGYFNLDIQVSIMTEFGTLEQYLQFSKNCILETKFMTVPRNRDLYLHLLKNSGSNFSLLLRYAYYALDPYEWIEIVKTLRTDKGEDFFIDFIEMMKEYVVIAYDEGHTYWAITVVESDLF